METSTLTSKGQIVIPSKIRELLGLKSGNKIGFVVKADNNVTLVPVNDDLFERLAGSYPGKKSLTKELLKERKADRLKEEKKWLQFKSRKSKS